MNPMAARLSHILRKWRPINGPSDLLLNSSAVTEHHFRLRMSNITFCALRLLHDQMRNFQHMPFQTSVRPLKSQHIALQSSNAQLAKTFSFQLKCMHQKVNEGPNKDNSLALKNSDICVVTDDAGVEIARSTFKEAKSLATTKKSRLVFIRRDRDGSLLFKLQAIADTITEPKPKRDTERKENNKKKQQEKNLTKEFTIKASINEHDLDIKITKMRAIIEKNKSVIIFIKSGSSKDQNAAFFSKKFTGELGEVCKVHQDYSNETTTRYTLTPRGNTSPEH